MKGPWGIDPENFFRIYNSNFKRGAKLIFDAEKIRLRHERHCRIRYGKQTRYLESIFR